MAYLLGVDQGTTLTTAVGLDEDGTLAASRSVKTPASYPRPDRVEQAPWRILDSVRQIVGSLAQEYPAAALGFDNQGETFLIWERSSGQPLTPAIGWQDKRGLTVCQGVDVQVAAARGATAVGIANLAAHSALGVSLAELARCWKPERVFHPAISVAERLARLAAWQRGLDAVRRFHRG